MSRTLKSFINCSSWCWLQGCYKPYRDNDFPISSRWQVELTPLPAVLARHVLFSLQLLSVLLSNLPQNPVPRKFYSGIKPQSSGCSDILVGPCPDEKFWDFLWGSASPGEMTLLESLLISLRFFFWKADWGAGISYSSPFKGKRLKSLELSCYYTISQIDSWGNSSCDAISTDFFLS